MEVMEQITIDQWMSWKEDIREKLRETAGNFVYIGYRLKQIRDSGLYGGAGDIFEFAFREYGLSKSTVSRFIAINEKFSEGGNSLELKEEYRAIGSSKLAEMLTLTDAECSLITEKTTVAQIRELKSFSRQQDPGEEEQEEAGTGQEPEDRQEASSWTPLQKCIIEYFRGKKEMLDEAAECILRGDNKKASEIINPSGNATCRKGLIFLFMNEYKDGVKYKMFGKDDITVLEWDAFLEEISGIFRPGYSSAAGVYDQFYGALVEVQKSRPEKMEKTPERRNEEGSVATSQQEEKEDKKDAEKIEDETAPAGGDKTDADAPADDADEAEHGDNEDGAGGSDGEGDLEDDGSRKETPGADRCGYALEETAGGMEQEEACRAPGLDYEDGRNDNGHEEAYIEIEFLLKDMEESYISEKWDELIEQAEKVIENAEKMKKKEDE